MIFAFYIQTYNANDRFWARAGIGHGAIPILDLYGNRGDDIWDFNTDMVTLRWYTDHHEERKGWRGYVQRLD